MPSGVYKIENTATGMMYVGSGVDLRERQYRHLLLLRRGEHRNPHLQSAWARYGEDSFAFQVLLYCSRDNLMLYEQRAIDGFRAAERGRGYNICAKAYSKLGVPCSELSKSVTRARMLGGIPSAENRRLTAERNKTPAMRAAASAAHKGKPRTLESREKQSRAKAGIPLSAEHREKLVPFWNSRRGVKRPEHAEKLRGGKRSDATKAQMSAARKAWWNRKKGLLN